MAASKWKGAADPAQSGIAVVSVSASLTGTATVTFNQPYSTAPFVKGLAVIGTNAWSATITSGLTTTGMVVGVRRVDGGAATTTSITVHWSVGL